MLSRALVKDALREVRRSPARFFSILAIVAIGAGLFVGIKAAAPDMKFTADQYYDQQNMMDIRVLSTLGLDQADIDAIAAVEGVEQVQPAYFVDVTTMAAGVEYVLRVHSLPRATRADGDTAVVNSPRLVAGRLPTGPGECVIERNRNLQFPLQIGASIAVASGTAANVTETLAHTRYTIVGEVVSPYYLTFDHGPSDIGGGRVNLFMMVGAAEFRYPAFTEALVTVDGARALDSYSTAYSSLVGRVVGRLQNLGEERAPIRLATIKRAAQKELDQAKADFAAEQARYDRGIADAEQTLSDARDELIAGRAELAAQRESFKTQVSTSEDTIRQFGAQLVKSQALFNSSTASYRRMLSQADSLISQARRAGREAKQAYRDAGATIDSLLELSQAENLTEEQRKTLQETIGRQSEIRKSADQMLGAIEKVTSTANRQVSKAKGQLNSAAAQLRNARAQLEDAKRQLAAAKARAQREFAAAERSLAAGQRDVDAGEVTLAAKKLEGAEELREGQQKITDAQDQIDRLNAPTWYVLDRTKLYSYADYAATAERMDAIAALFPVFFFAVAALVCLTTMTRMIDEQRTSIGTYKALGYDETAISLKYAGYAAFASVIGGALGVTIGINVFPRVIFDSWAMMYELPAMQEVGQAPLLVVTVVVSVLLTTATSVLVVRSELASVPAALMRPKAPVSGRVILLERIPPLWGRLSFSQKVTMRNIFRYKKRFFMTVIGVAGCAALLVAGLGLSDSIGSIVPRQYGEIFRQDLGIRFAATATTADRTAVLAELDRDARVAATLQVAEMNATVRGATADLSATLVVPLEVDRADDFVTLRSHEGGEPLPLADSGAVITAKLAALLGARVGDLIPIDRGTGVSKQVVVTGIAENYVFHFIYLSPKAFREVFGAEPEITGVYLTTTDAGRAAETALGSGLIDTGDVAAVTYYSDAITKFEETIRSLDTIVLAMVISAGLLAFVVLYNLTIINLSERAREIATIKVLGFFNREVASYIYRENILLTVLGAAVGLGVGVGLHRAIMASIEQDNVMFGHYIANSTYAYAFLLTIGFGLAVSVFTYRKLTVVKMVESLKSIE